MNSTYFGFTIDRLEIIIGIELWQISGKEVDLYANMSPAPLNEPPYFQFFPPKQQSTIQFFI